jgi:hypothetical protein
MPLDAPAFCSWIVQAPLPEARTYLAVAGAANNVYVLGGYRWDAATSQLVYYDSVLRGVVESDGSIRSWSAQPSFQTGRSGLGVARLGSCLFLNGGSWSSGNQPMYGDDTQYARIGGDGRLSSWTTSPNRLRTPRSNHTLLAFETSGGKFLQAVAGVTQMGQDTVHLDTIEYARVGDDCQVGPWTIADYHLRGGRSSPQALNIGGNVVVVGGWGDLDLIDVFDDVQIATVRPDGSPSPWQVPPARLPTGLYGHATAFVDGGASGGPTLFAVAGQPGTGAYGNWIAYAYAPSGLSLANALGIWRIAPSGQLPSGRAGHGVVAYGPRLYVIGGNGPGGLYLTDVLSAQFDTGRPQ